MKHESRFDDSSCDDEFGGSRKERELKKNVRNKKCPCPVCGGKNRLSEKEVRQGTICWECSQ